MENNVAAVVSIEQKSPSVKVHGRMCLELTNLLNRITCILPALESARPGGRIGIQELSLLSNTVEKGKLIIQHCAECSKLYLAITGVAITSRCERIRSSLCKSLTQIRSMVPLLLASQVEQILDHLICAKFVLDPDEDEAGKAIIELLQQTDSTEELESKSFQIASTKLNLTSAKEILIERRSVKKLLDQVRGMNLEKEDILEFFLHLLKKYGKKGMPDDGNLIEKRNGENERLIPGSCSSSSTNSSEMYTGQTNQHETSGDFCLSEPQYLYSVSSLNNINVAFLNNKPIHYYLQGDHSNVSNLSADASFSDSSHGRVTENLKENFTQMFTWSVDYQKHQSFSKFDHGMYVRFFDTLSELPMELRCKSLEDVKIVLEGDEKTCYDMMANGFPEALLNFLKSCHDRSDVQSLKHGARLFLAFLKNQSVEILPSSDDAFRSLTSLVCSEITTEVLMILRILSHIPTCKPKLVASGVAPPIIENLSCEDSNVIEMSMEILSELSYHNDIISVVISSGCISTLSSFLSDEGPAECCLKILRNMSNVEEGTALIAKTDGCIASIVELLDTGSREAQEYAVSVLYSLCCFSSENCLLALKEVVFPPLVHLSVNGNDNAQETSLKLLQLLRDSRHSNSFNGSGLPSESNHVPPEESTDQSVNEQPTSKSSWWSEKRTKFFTKIRPLFWPVDDVS